MTSSEITSAITLVQRIRDEGAHHLRRAQRPRRAKLGDRLIVLNNDRLIAEGDPREVLQEAAVVAAYLGSANVEA